MIIIIRKRQKNQIFEIEEDYELKTLKKGQKISIRGIIDENFQPVTLYDFNIIK